MDVTGVTGARFGTVTKTSPSSLHVFYLRDKSSCDVLLTQSSLTSPVKRRRHCCEARANQRRNIF